MTVFPGTDPAPFYVTGASGDPTALPDETAPVLMAGVRISTPYQSSQIPATEVVVSVADTAAQSAGPIPPSGDPMTGLSVAALTSTGAGQGRWRPHNPNSETVL